MDEKVMVEKLSRILGKSEQRIKNTSLLMVIEELVKVIEKNGELKIINNLNSDELQAFKDAWEIAKETPCEVVIREVDRMDFKEYQELAERTMPKKVKGKYEIYYDEKAIINYCFGLAGESGEFIDLVKKEMFHGHPENEIKKKKELGDILHYVTGLCTMYGWRLEDVARLNVEKLKERYPEGFSKEDSLNRIDK
jgi:NTP pyrophosphatase (non-canonical NTP hydrolase)